MPTDEATVKDPTSSTDAPQDVTDHPVVQKLQEELSQAKQREAAARKGMDQAMIEAKRLKKAIVEPLEEEEEEPEVAQEPTNASYATKEELWEVAHAKEIAAYADEEYKSDIASGIPRDYALKTAKLRQLAPKDAARRERQETMASASTTDRSLAGEDDIQVTEEQKKRGITKEMIKKYKDMV